VGSAKRLDGRGGRRDRRTRGRPSTVPELTALTLYQSEWCPFSSAVREVLTELGLDFVARQVEPWPEQRERLRAVTGSELIPVLETEDGRLYRGTREIFAQPARTRTRGDSPPRTGGRFADHRGRARVPTRRAS
jgi:glutaredoxin